ncbi:MAG: NYN domain-containing protein [Treponema sp.]|nr:NYN domain-containing protein [Treponema sp.]
MEKNLLDILRIGIFYDGYYFYKVSNYYKYEHEKKSRISISGLHDFIRSEVAALTKTDMRQCRIIDAHYFKGRSSARELGEKVQSERVFEDILMRENIVSHYLPLRFGENNSVQEKGIDVWLALEAYELAIYKHFDILVLVAGDGDYVPLVRKLHTVGTQVMLICWDFSYHNENGDVVETKTSRQLQEEVFFAVPMHQKIEQQDNEYTKDLFVPEKIYDRTPAVSSFKSDDSTGITIEENKEEFTSTIFSINPNGFGFIKDEDRNNIFFHYSRVANCDFPDLKFGMNVKYSVEEDPDRSKRDGAQRFRATKVTVI